jgi:hypothetical protein
LLVAKQNNNQFSFDETGWNQHEAKMFYGFCVEKNSFLRYYYAGNYSDIFMFWRFSSVGRAVA